VRVDRDGRHDALQRGRRARRLRARGAAAGHRVGPPPEHGRVLGGRLTQSFLGPAGHRDHGRRRRPARRPQELGDLGARGAELRVVEPPPGRGRPDDAIWWRTSRRP
jgi:hypothetical protein